MKMFYVTRVDLDSLGEREMALVLLLLKYSLKNKEVILLRFIPQWSKVIICMEIYL